MHYFVKRPFGKRNGVSSVRFSSCFEAELWTNRSPGLITVVALGVGGAYVWLIDFVLSDLIWSNCPQNPTKAKSMRSRVRMASTPVVFPCLLGVSVAQGPYGFLCSQAFYLMLLPVLPLCVLFFFPWMVFKTSQGGRPLQQHGMTTPQLQSEVWEKNSSPMLSLSPAKLSHQPVTPYTPPHPTNPPRLGRMNTEQRDGRKGVWKPPRAVSAKGAKWLKWLENPIYFSEHLTLSQVGQRNQGPITTKWPGKQSAVNRKTSQSIEHIVLAYITVRLKINK